MAPPTPTPEKKKRVIRAVNKYMANLAAKKLFANEMNHHFKNKKLNLARRNTTGERNE